MWSKDIVMNILEAFDLRGRSSAASPGHAKFGR